MKNIKMGAILLITTASLTSAAFAQTTNQIKQIRSHSDTATLRSLSETLGMQHAKNYSGAVAYAAKNSWPLTKTSAEGDFQVLDGITSDNQPIYHQSLNRNAGIACRAAQVYTNGGALQLNLHGEGMTAAIWDVGPVRTMHQAFQSRAMQIDVSVTPNTAFLTAHPTHVAGTIISSNNFVDGTARGIAFAGNLIAYTSNGDRAEAATAAANGLLVSNHSYASDGYAGGFAGLYTSVAHDWDQIMSAAPYYLSVWACGNAGGPFRKVSNSSANKNGLAVGSIADVTYPSGYYSPLYSGNIPVILASSSSAGPTNDGRIKPDIMTRGVNIYSSMSDTDSSYAYSTGTSMAAPSATGSVLLLQQLYQQKHGYFMKSATVKGLIIHTATEIGTAGPEPNTGWGLLNVENAAFAIVNDGGITNILEDQLLNGTSFTKTVIAADTNPLMITLSWTDPAGAGIIDSTDHSPRLINDLDLVVTSNNITYQPWKLDLSGNSLQGNNSVDNVEKIQIFNPTPGQPYTITVAHKGSLLNGSQYFSLISSGTDTMQPMPTYVANVKGEDGSLHLFPNPNHGLFTLRSQQSEASVVQILGILGNVLMEKRFGHPDNIEVDIRNLANGTYIVRLISGKGIFMRAVVKN